MFISSVGLVKASEYKNNIQKTNSRSTDGITKGAVDNQNGVSNPIVTANMFLPQLSFGARTKYPTYDSFTGLRDKKCLFKDLETLMTKKSESGEDVSVAMFDMDNFKSVNELLGYKTGDEFIKSMSNNVGKVAKANDLEAYRFGGDEFVIIFDKQSKEEQNKIVEDVLQITNSDRTFKLKKGEYLENADARLRKLGSSNAKIHELFDLKAKKTVLDDLHQNLSTDEAKNDPYLQTSIATVDNDVKSLYLDLLDVSIEREDDDDVRDNLIYFRERIENDEPVEKEERNTIDDYLRSKFYKSLEIYQTKKWLADFNKNGGFSVTGGIVSYSPDYYADKMPIDLVDETGELLKKGKSTKKGRGYFFNRGV